MKVRTLAVFGAGYVFGTRAGRERYGQIIAAAQRAPERLQGYSDRLDSFSGTVGGFREQLDALKTKLQHYSGE